MKHIEQKVLNEGRQRATDTQLILEGRPPKYIGTGAERSVDHALHCMQGPVSIALIQYEEKAFQNQRRK